MCAIAKQSATEAADESTQVGQRLRSAREELGLSLREVARRLDISASALSQIETGKSRPSVKTLYAIVSELGLSMDQLFADSGGQTQKPKGPTTVEEAASMAPNGSGQDVQLPVVQPAASRSSLDLDSGVTWDRLTAAHDPNVDFLHTTYHPGSSSSGSEKLVRHNGREYGVVLSGELELTVGFEKYRLGPGDACSFDSNEPHRLANPGSVDATAIWFVIGRRQSDPTSISFDAD
ncbi:MAG TPA: helix-turn-helix domain-containing protein [Solirubrobacterales bacterium]|nr:helix-turn-helix domain-containing protein [Solirubrobacterales bacterium]